MAMRLQARNVGSLAMDVMRSRSSESRRSDVDEISLVKAVAWAWYQHGNEGRKASSKEFVAVDAKQRQGGYRPSRYKLEALKAERARSSSMEVPLLDAYELERITAQLKSLSVDCDDHKIGGTENGEMEVEEKKKRVVGRVNGFWPRRAARARICGTIRDAVVKAKVLVRIRSRGGGGGRRRAVVHPWRWVALL